MGVHKILKFRATSGFSKWQKYFPENSVAHPAKINLHLLNYLIQNYTEEGDTICDPMAGTGSTVVLSMLNNRNAVGVELEEKFTGWATQAVNNVEREQTLTPKGKGIVICGDARKLSEVLKEYEEKISSVLFSPPYMQQKKADDRDSIVRRINEGSIDKNHPRLKQLLDSEQVGSFSKPGYNPNNPSNIGNLPTGDIDSVIFSPPYADTEKRDRSKEEWFGEEIKNSISCGMIPIQKGYQGAAGNIGNLSFIAAILFSAPYFSTRAFQDFDFMMNTAGDASTRIEEGIIKGHGFTAEARRRAFEKQKQGEIEDAENIGNIKDFGVDAVLTSPPYEKTVKDHGKRDRATKINIEKNNHSSFAYSGDENNIGNQKKESYLEAMKTVYAECHKVLKPQGLMILILKNFIRGKKVVPLTDHTVKICESVGFALKERLLFKLPTQSFWRRLYSQKYPEVDTADLRYEHILIFEKYNEYVSKHTTKYP